MRNKNPLIKFIFNKGAIIILIILAIVLATAYAYTLFKSSELSLKVSTLDTDSLSKSKILEEYNTIQTWSEIVLVVFSVAGSALISTLLIEKRNSNKIVEEVVVNDFFTSDKFLQILEDEKKKSVLTALEKQLNFDNCNEKAEMYVAVKEKLNKPVFDYDFAYEKYYLHVICNINDTFIEKSIVKSVEIKSLSKPVNVNGYTILSITTTKQDEYNPVEITKLKINGEDQDLKLIKKMSNESNDPLDKKRGYIENIKFLWQKTLNFSNKKTLRIEIEYKTRCPLHDLAYTCRMPYPCKNFDFNFVVKNDNFEINPTAFGFIDDAKNSPNHTDDRKRVSIKFDDWIFPLDGVCVYLEKSVAKI